MRIIQRFGRIDRIGSRNDRIQLVNFWPNMELEEYINLEQRVSGRMVLLDISATGEENIIEHQSGNQMNDLEYRRKQLLKLQDAVIDLEDLTAAFPSPIYAQRLPHRPGGIPQGARRQARSLPLGTFAVTTAQGNRRGHDPAGRHLLPARRGRGGAKAIEPAIRSRRTTSCMSATTARSCCPSPRPSRCLTG